MTTEAIISQEAARAMLQALREIRTGSAVTGRWIGPDLEVCDAPEEGEEDECRWEPYTHEEQSEWLATVADTAAKAIALAEAPAELEAPTPLPQVEPETLAWEWMDKHFVTPADQDYSADQMVDAFLAGLGSQPKKQPA